MKKIGLVGYPIAHSGSPKLFYDTFAQNRSVLEQYSYDLIETDDFSLAAERFYNEYIAVNVTTPYKEDALALADEYSYPVERIMATNLLIKDEDGVVTAYNTDYLALKMLIPQGQKVVVIGCGGAAKAAVVAALENGCNVSIYNRTESKVVEFLFNLKINNPRGIPSAVDILKSEDLAEAVAASDVVVYAISSPVELFDRVLLSGKILIEANYREPLYSKESLDGVSAQYIGGERWLELQAIETYRLIGLLENPQ